MESALLRNIFAEKSDAEFVNIRVLKRELEGDGNTKVLANKYFVSIAKAEKFIDKHRSDGDVYFGVCTRKEQKATAESVARGYCVWADIDTNESRNQHDQITFIAPPSIIVSSGNGLHVYWLLETPTKDLEKLRQTAKLISGIVGGDDISDCARILRVENTFNYKYEQPKPVSILREVDVRYDLNDLKGYATLDDKVAQRILTGNTRGFKTRSERDWSVVVALVRVGVSNQGILNIFLHNKIGDKVEEGRNIETYLKHTVSRAREQSKIPEGTNAQLQVGDIFERNGSYWKLTAKNAIRLSSFIFEPNILIKRSGVESPIDALVGDIKSKTDQAEAQLTRKAFVTVAALCKELPSIDWAWYGKDADVRHFQTFLMDKLREKGTPTKEATNTLGYHKKSNSYVLSEQTITQNAVLSTAESEVHLLASKGARPITHYATKAPDAQELQKFFILANRINKPEVIWVALGWWAACALKVQLEALKYRFPILNLFGTRGSGKTTIVKEIIQVLAGYVEPEVFECTTTQFVMLSLLGATTSVPVSFGEYRQSKRVKPLLNILRASYDSGHNPRGRSDQTVQDYKLSAPFTIDGEDALTDAAALERVLLVHMHPEDIAEGTDAYDAFNELTHQTHPPCNLNRIGAAFLQYALTIDIPQVLEEAIQLVRVAFPETLPDRPRRNLVVTTVGLLSLAAFAETLTVPFAINTSFLDEVLRPCLGNIVKEGLGRTEMLVDDMVTDLVNQAAKLGGEDGFTFKHDPNTNVLWFHFTTAFSWWLQLRGKERTGDTLSKSAMRAQMNERLCLNGTAKPGQYITGNKRISIDGNTYLCLGISIEAAHTANLDVPEQLNKRSFVMPKAAASRFQNINSN